MRVCMLLRFRYTALMGGRSTSMEYSMPSMGFLYERTVPTLLPSPPNSSALEENTSA